MKKSITLLLALITVLVLGTAALADTYNIAGEYIEVIAQASGNPLVGVEGAGYKEDGDGNVIITGTETSSTAIALIAVDGSLSVTFKNVNLTDEDSSLFAVSQTGRTVTVNLEGENKIPYIELDEVTPDEGDSDIASLRERSRKSLSSFVSGKTRSLKSGGQTGGTAKLVFNGKSSGKLITSYIEADGNNIVLTLQNMSGDIGACFAEGWLGSTLNISNSTLNADVIEIVGEGNTYINVKDSDLKVTGESGMGLVCLTTAEARATGTSGFKNDITFVNSTADISCGVKSGVGCALGAGSFATDGRDTASITLNGCKYEDATHYTGKVELSLYGDTITGVATVTDAKTLKQTNEGKTGTIVYATKIVKAATPVPTTGDENTPLLFAGLLLLAGAGLVVLKKRSAR